MITIIIIVMNTGEHAENPHNGNDRAGETRLALYIYQFIIMLSPIYNHFNFGPIEDIGWSNRGSRGHDWTVL